MRKVLIIIVLMIVIPLVASMVIPCDGTNCISWRSLVTALDELKIEGMPEFAGEATAMEKGSENPVWAYERYYSRDYRFSVAFPQGWELANEEDAASLGAISPRAGFNDSFRENALVGSFELTEELSLLEYFSGNLEYLKDQVPDLVVDNMQMTKLDGLDAIRLVYTSQIEGMSYKTIQVFALKEGRGYIVTGMGQEMAYNDYEEIFDGIVKSFRFE